MRRRWLENIFNNRKDKDKEGHGKTKRGKHNFGSLTRWHNNKPPTQLIENIKDRELRRNQCLLTRHLMMIYASLSVSVLGKQKKDVLKWKQQHIKIEETDGNNTRSALINCDHSLSAWLYMEIANSMGDCFALILIGRGLMHLHSVLCCAWDSDHLRQGMIYTDPM